jgi:hypothetical protein
MEGLAVGVIEARGRLGGRIWTIRDARAPVPLELGAEFVHGRAPHTRELLARAGAHTVDVDADSWQASGGSIRSSSTWERIGRVLSGLDAKRQPDRSFADYLRASADAFAPDDLLAATAFVEGFFAADAERIGERALASSGGPETAANSSRIPQGYDVVVSVLSEGLDVLMEHAVERMEWRRGTVQVYGSRTGSRRPFRPLCAPAVVVTLPLGVLASSPGTPGTPEISPSPVSWNDALAGIEMGAALRLLLAFDRPVAEVLGDACPEPFDGFLHVPERAPHAFWTLSPLTDRVLVAWSGGARTRGLPRTRDALVEEAVRVLVDEAGVRREVVDASLTGAFWHDWESDPWTRGAYAYPLAGGDAAPEALAAPVEGTLFLAGEATSSEEMGTVEGALASGVRAAEAVIEVLGRAGG